MGAIAAFLALAATGLTSHEDKLVGSVYLAMKLIGWKVIVPLGVGSLLTGLVLARHSVGPVPALLGSFEVCAHCRRNCSATATHDIS